MIQARHTWLGNFLMKRLVFFLIKRHFETFQVEFQPDIDPRRPVLMLANHFSWWDGFTHYYLNERYFKKRYHVMMLEEELAKRKWFRNAGAFSVKHGARSITDTLQYAGQLLNEPNNLVLMFPTGRIQSIFDPAFPFEKGIGKILDKATDEVQLIYSVILPEFGNKPKPALYAYFKHLENPKAQTRQVLEEGFHHFYQEACRYQRQKTF